MKFVLFNDFQLGVLENDSVYEISDKLLGEGYRSINNCSMIQLIRQFENKRGEIEENLTKLTSYPLSEVLLRQPVSQPGKIVAAPVNYLSHKKEMNQANTARGLGFFLKAGTSLIGPGDTIMLPYEDRRVDHELELAFVIGKTARNVKAENAFDYIFGYTGLIDVTLRPDEQHEEERCLRKSFDTFTPLGPCIVTKEEIDPDNVNMKLTNNGEVRQKVNTEKLICNVAELVELFSRVMTLEPGDIVATGTPDGVGPIKEGDQVTLDIEGIGDFSVNVRLADN